MLERGEATLTVELGHEVRITRHPQAGAALRAGIRKRQPSLPSKLLFRARDHEGLGAILTETFDCRFCCHAASTLVLFPSNGTMVAQQVHATLILPFPAA